MRTAGRTVVFSAATVAAALATLTLFPLGFAQSMGIAGACVAVVAALASLAVSPALLVHVGHQAAAAAATPARPPRTTAGTGSRTAVMRRPGVIAAVTAALMLAIALPALGVKWTPVDATALPTDKSARIVSDAIQRDFGGAGATPVTVASRRPPTAPPCDAFADRIKGLEGVSAVAAPADLGGDTWRVTVTAPGQPSGETARGVVDEIRALDPPFATAVTGPAAEFADQQAAIGSRLLPAVLLLCAMTFGVLWLMTGLGRAAGSRRSP